MFRKSMSLLLATFILLQSMNMHFKDILNLGVLLEHIEFHQAEYGDDLFVFLAKHYGDKMLEHHGQKKDEHRELPFHQTVCFDGGQLFLMNNLNSKWLNAFEAERQKSSFYYTNIYSYLDHSDIFQPPRTT